MSDHSNLTHARKCRLCGHNSLQLDEAVSIVFEAQPGSDSPWQGADKHCDSDGGEAARCQRHVRRHLSAVIVALLGTPIRAT